MASSALVACNLYFNGYTRSPASYQPTISSFYSNGYGRSKKLPVISLSVRSSLLSTPPNTKEEAIQQAKTCLANVLDKHLNNPRLTGSMKKLRQPRFQVEIPVMDDSPVAICRLAVDIFSELPLKKKGFQFRTLILWPSTGLLSSAVEAFESPETERNVANGVIGASINKETDGALRSADVVVFFAATTSNLTVIKEICDRIVPKLVLMFNPEWGFGEAVELGKFKPFAASFEVIYAFAGLAVQGILKTRKGMVFRCLDGGTTRDEKWAVLVEEGGEMKVVTKFKTRPSMDEIGDVLYNVMALNSPITKSAKFFKQLVSTVTGKK